MPAKRTEPLQKSLRRRAELYRRIRDYFQSQGVLEVEVPVLGRSSALDPHLASMSLQSLGSTYYLQTSPELFMKRLLAQGSGSIFSIGKAFREAEVSSRHNPEFSMLEWYRVDYSLEQLMDDVSSLLRTLMPSIEFKTFRYLDLFEEHLGINPHSCSDKSLYPLVQAHTSYSGELDRASCLDLLMTQVIEPNFQGQSVFVVDFPVCQAAMSQIVTDQDGNRVAKRFELYMLDMELANGYLELIDEQEQRKRFQQDREFRQAQGLPPIPEDKAFLKALKQGMPKCAGVALGLDRLLWVCDQLQTGVKNDIDLSSYISFPWPEL